MATSPVSRWGKMTTRGLKRRVVVWAARKLNSEKTSRNGSSATYAGLGELADERRVVPDFGLGVHGSELDRGLAHGELLGLCRLDRAGGSFEARVLVPSLFARSARGSTTKSARVSMIRGLNKP